MKVKYDITVDKIRDADNDKELRSQMSIDYATSQAVFDKMRGMPLSDMVSEALLLGFMAGLKARK
jgi:hypothetical protein